MKLAQFTRSAVQQALSALEQKLGPQPIPGLRDTDRLALLRYLRPIQEEAKNVGFGVGSYVHGATVANLGYVGGVYSPTEDKIYFAPNNEAPDANWHYVNCKTGAIVEYANGVAPAVAGQGYSGGVYSPTQNRIYFAPTAQAPSANWHYIDCDTGTVVEYAHGLAVPCVNFAYRAGVYSPTQNRIYFVPYLQAPEATWHYIDCDDGSVVPYVHGASVGTQAYNGGVYSPTQNRIYLVPSGQSDKASWHYIDCNDGSVVSYAHGATVEALGYIGGAYSPTQNRIYFAPTGQSDNAVWHYVDCDTGNVVAYTHPNAVALDYAYYGGVYSPAQNRIYFVPNAQAPEAQWHYVDCNTGDVVAYAHGITVVGSYSSGIFSPTNNRIYMVPYGAADELVWHYIQEYSDVPVSRNLMAGALFNKF